MNVASLTLTAGRPWPMGATYDGDGVNFAVFSAHAERVELCLFSPDGRREMARIALRDGDSEGKLGVSRHKARKLLCPFCRSDDASDHASASLERDIVVEISAGSSVAVSARRGLEIAVVLLISISASTA